MGDRSGMSISADSPSDETLNQGSLALLLRRQYEFPFGINIVQFSIFFNLLCLSVTTSGQGTVQVDISQLSQSAGGVVVTTAAGDNNQIAAVAGDSIVYFADESNSSK